MGIRPRPALKRRKEKTKGYLFSLLSHFEVKNLNSRGFCDLNKICSKIILGPIRQNTEIDGKYEEVTTIEAFLSLSWFLSLYTNSILVKTGEIEYAGSITTCFCLAHRPLRRDHVLLRGR